jgi:hypothetical protein
MRQVDVRKLVRVALLGLMAAVLIAVGAAAGAGAVSAQSQDTSPHHAQAIVDEYLGILNAGMASGTCDFSALSTVYASDATLTLAGGPFSPGGPAAFVPSGPAGEQQYQGIDAITGFYTHFCGFLTGPHGPGYGEWTQDEAHLLAPNVLNSYEHVRLSRVPPAAPPGRCVHAFTISGDKIASLDWSVYA